jgi:hypothetical protein
VTEKGAERLDFLECATEPRADRRSTFSRIGLSARPFFDWREMTFGFGAFHIDRAQIQPQHIW